MLGLSNGVGYTGEDISDITPPSSYSMAFDGTGDMLTFTETSFPIELTGEDLSISFWCKRTDNNDEAVILGNSGTASYKRLNFDSDGDRLYIEGDQNGEYAYGAVTADTNWHHYVVSHLGYGSGSGGIGEVIMYEDGAAVTTCNTAGGGCNFGNKQDKDFTINRIGADSGSGTEFKGLLYQLVIFKLVLTDDVVTAMYNGGTPISLDNMVGISHFWKFSENTGSTTADSVGSLTATLAGNAAFSEDVPE